MAVLCGLAIAEQAFLSVRQRLARQLLFLATAGPGPDLVVHACQQELADAIGSVREVVTRNLHQLHEGGLIDVSRDEIVILDPVALAEGAGEPARVAADGDAVPVARPRRSTTQ